jgi:hypothetical protein
VTFGLLRIAAQLRRIAKALERSNELAEERLLREENPKHQTRKFVFSKPKAKTVEEMMEELEK